MGFFKKIFGSKNSSLNEKNEKGKTIAASCTNCGQKTYLDLQPSASTQKSYSYDCVYCGKQSTAGIPKGYSVVNSRISWSEVAKFMGEK